MTQYEEYLYIALRATFGGAPNLYEWGVISESVTDLANMLMQDESWDPSVLSSNMQASIPPDHHIDRDVPFVPALPTVVSLPR